MTGWALFCIKFIGRNAKHIVALDAHAVQNGTGNGRRFGRTFWRGAGTLGGGSLGGHRVILTRERGPAKGEGGIPIATWGIFYLHGRQIVSRMNVFCNEDQRQQREFFREFSELCAC